MASVYKCDRCGAVYARYEKCIETRERGVVTYEERIRVTTEKRKVEGDIRYPPIELDLCAACQKKFLDWLKEGRRNGC